MSGGRIQEEKKISVQKELEPSCRVGSHSASFASTNRQNQIPLSEMKTIPGGLSLFVVASVALIGMSVSTYKRIFDLREQQHLRFP